MNSRWHRVGWPRALLAAVLVLSLAARVALIGEPCRRPCRTAADHVLVFDEVYYVPAARVIAGLPAGTGQRYQGAPARTDPNSEHPQLVKLAIAGLIRALGDGPWAWRLPSLLTGTLAILGLWALVRAAGGSEAEASVSAALLAADNLILVHGRIGTLDMPALAAMLWAVALALRGRWAAGAAVLALGAGAKEVALLAVGVFGLIELRRTGWRSRRGWKPVAGFGLTAAALWLLTVEVMDWVAPPWDPLRHRRVGGGALGHVAHMLGYGASQRSLHGQTGIASGPWLWPIDLKPIVYLNVNPGRPVAGLEGVHPAAHFLGMISPPVLLAGLVGIGLALARRGPGGNGLRRAGWAWLAATYLPFLAAAIVLGRTSYLYYMVVVMPGLAMLGAGWLVALARSHRRIALGYGGLVLLAAVAMYPFTPVPG
jgi:predicted membrane-bound dolichyl-phosphate-mannose-protein mannosyltransferase